MPGGLDVVRVNFTAHQVEALDVAGDGDGAAAKVRVKNALARLRVVLKEPAVEGDGLLANMNTVVMDAAFGVDLRVSVHGCPSQFTVCQCVHVGHLVPHNPATGRGQFIREVVPAPDYLS